MLWELLVRNNLGVFLEEVVERGVHSQREYASKEEGHGGSLDSILPCLLVPAKHLLRPLFVSWGQRQGIMIFLGFWLLTFELKGAAFR